MISQVRAQNYDIIICPHRSLRSSLITHFSGAKIRIGFNKNSLSNLLTSRVYYNKESHEIERNLDLVRAIPKINFDENKKILQPSLFPSKEDTECVAEASEYSALDTLNALDTHNRFFCTLLQMVH